jgi:hypothetical protein
MAEGQLIEPLEQHGQPVGGRDRFEERVCVGQGQAALFERDAA